MVTKLFQWTQIIILSGLMLIFLLSTADAGVNFGMNITKMAPKMEKAYSRLETILIKYHNEIHTGRLDDRVWNDLEEIKAVGLNQLTFELKQMWIEVFHMIYLADYRMGLQELHLFRELASQEKLVLPEFTSNLQAEMFALKWHYHSDLVPMAEEKRGKLLAKAVTTATGVDEVLERTARIEQADYLLRIVRTLGRDDFETLLEAYSSSPVGAEVYTSSRPLTEAELKEWR